MRKAKRAISLINLIIILIMIIIVGTIILVLCADALDITGNQKEKFKSSMSTYNSSLDSYKGKIYVKTSGSFNEYTLSANAISITYNGEEQSGNIFDILPTLEGAKFDDKIVITNGKIDVSNLKKKYIEWAVEELGNSVITEKVVEKVREKRSDIGEGTDIKEDAIKDKVPYVPEGFNYIDGTTVENGYVIVDKLGNEYVWIPVKDATILDEKVLSNNESYKALITEYNTIKSSIKLYGGFYVGRYEASNVDGKVSSRKDMIPWLDIKWGDSIKAPGVNGAFSLAKGVSATNGYSEFASSLIYDTLWDIILEFMEVSKDNNSLSYGNYNGVSFDVESQKARGSKDGKNFELVTNKPVNSRMVLTTGATSRNCKKNIYDMAGNVSEWIISLNSLGSDNAISRGANYYDLSNALSARYAVEKSVTEHNITTGFRVMLYIK